MAGKFHRYARQQTGKKNGYRLTLRRRSHFRERPARPRRDHGLPRRRCNPASQALPLIEVEPAEGLVDKLDRIGMSLGHDNRMMFAAKVECARRKRRAEGKIGQKSHE
jgi:hypothetical protein